MSTDSASGREASGSPEATESTTDTGGALDAPGHPSRGDETPTPVELTHAPPRASQVVAVVGALIGVALTVPFAPLALPFGVGGFLLVAAGITYQHSRAWVTVGVGLVLVGSLITGAYGAVSTEVMLVAVSATILAWDVGQQGIVIGEQLGRETRLRRKLFVHTGLSTLVIGFVSMLAYASYLLSAGGRQAGSVAIVVVGVVLLIWLLRE